MTKAGYINIVCTPEKRICNFYIKDKLKSEIFNDKKSL